MALERGQVVRFTADTLRRAPKLISPFYERMYIAEIAEDGTLILVSKMDDQVTIEDVPASAVEAA